MNLPTSFAPGDPVRVKSLLLTMDIVDQLRHRETQLAELSDTDQTRDDLRARVVSMYRAQGIEVSDRMVDDALLAQRERRFEHHPEPLGLTSLPAIAWVRRGILARAGAAVGVGVLCLSAVYHYGVVGPREHALTARVEFASQLQQQITDSHAKIGDRIAAASAGLETALAGATSAPLAQRISPTVSRLKEAAETSLSAATRLAAASVGGSMPAPLTRDTIETAGAATERDLNSRAESLKAASVQLVAGEEAVGGITALAVASAALESAATALNDKPLSAARIQERGAVYAAGDRALRQGDAVAAVASANKLNAIGQELADLQNMRDNAEQFMEMGRQTQPSPEAADALTQAYQSFLAQADAGDQQAARGAIANLQVIVEQLQGNLTYRIVTRPGEPSALRRRTSKDPNAPKNYYVIVEAVDAQGKIVPLSIRDEETATISKVSKFGVRVNESVFEAVRKDKTDNGIVDNALVGRKPRGTLSPTFSVDVTGGYITRFE